MRLDELFPAGLTYRQCIKGGVYRLSDAVIAKRYDDWAVGERVMRLSEVVRDAGIVVPDILCAASIVPTIGTRGSSYLLMRNVPGQFVADLDCPSRAEAEALFRDSVRRVLSLGIAPEGVFWFQNSVYGNDGRVYLLDIDLWRESCDGETRERYERALASPSIFEYPIGRSR